jgi:hypothetical protein
MEVNTYSILIYNEADGLVARALEHNMMACVPAAPGASAALDVLAELERVIHTYKAMGKALPDKAPLKYWDMFDKGVPVSMQDLIKAANTGSSLEDLAKSKVAIWLGTAA